MILRSLRLLSFRAHAETRLDLAPKVNLLYGANGAGKTNVLEAIHYLCLSKSFLASSDTYALRKGCPYFEVEGQFEGVQRSALRVRLVYVPREEKKIFFNGAPLERLAEIVGVLPVVVFSPDDAALTAGGPDERRRFMNNILSQARPVYMDDLMKYRRARRQRNELLAQYQKRREPPPRDLLEPWTEELVLLGSRIIARRHRFLQVFAGFLEDAYARLTATGDAAGIERPTITYDTIADLPPETGEEEAADLLRRELGRTARRERERGRTLVGPQRDELVFRLGDLGVRRYGSQGQHRTFGMALKLAQYFYLNDRLEEPPILLLDDAFAKLDPDRTAAFLELLLSEAIGQSVITGTRRPPFESVVPFEAAAHRAARVERGAQGARMEAVQAVAE